MKPALALFALASAIPAWSPLSAQTHGPVSQTVANTIWQNAHRRGYSDAEADQAVAASSAKVIPAAGANRTSWLSWLKNLDTSRDGILWPFSLAWSGRDNADGRHPGSFCGLGGTWDDNGFCTMYGPFGGYGGGASGGGGATGSWDDPWQAACEEWKFSLDAEGNLIVPSIRFPPGKAMQKGQGIWRVPSGFNLAGAQTPMAMPLWWSHLVNGSRGSDQRNWRGVWKIVWLNGTPTFHAASQSYYNPAGALVQRTTATTVWNSTGYGNFSANKNCPETTGSGDFHFYASSSTNNTQQFDTCTWYVPNNSLGVGGYRYPDRVAITVGQFAEYIEGFHSLAACPIDPEFIRKVADYIYKQTTYDPGYDGPPYEPVIREDVMHDGQPPRVKDLTEPPTTLPEKSETREPPPSPPPGGGGSSNTPDYTHPTFISPSLTAPSIDWWPTLPTISLNFGTPTCPTYPINVGEPFNWNLLLEAHCPLIEANKAMISVIMLLVFGGWALVIVLRA